MVKESVLPILVGSLTSLYTVSQQFTITRFVTALKTVPSFEGFSPPENFTNVDQLFESAGSEKREHLLPGELEFSDQDRFGHDHVNDEYDDNYNDDDDQCSLGGTR